MADGVQAIVKRVVTKAKSGDLTAARLVLDRLVPVRRGRPIEVSLPPITDAAGVATAQAAVVEAAARGAITFEEAEALSSLIDNRRKSIEMLDHEARLAEIEYRLKARK